MLPIWLNSRTAALPLALLLFASISPGYFLSSIVFKYCPV